MRATRQKAERLVRMWRYRDVANAFELWQTHTLAMLAARDSAVLFAVRLMRGSAYRALNGWRDAVAVRRTQRTKVDKLLRKWLNRSLSSAFEGWHAAVVRFRVHRARVRSFVWRMRFAGATRSFRGWRDTTALLIRQRAVVANIHGIWTHKTVAAAFRAWHSTARTSKDKLARAKKIVARMRSMKQSIAFNAWADTVEKLVADRAVAHKIVARMTRVKVAGAWYTWIDRVEDRREWRARETRAMRFAARRERDRVESVLEAWFTEVKRLVVYRRRATQGCLPHQKLRHGQIPEQVAGRHERVQAHALDRAQGIGALCESVGQQDHASVAIAVLRAGAQDGHREKGGEEDGRSSHEALVEDLAVARRR